MEKKAGVVPRGRIFIANHRKILQRNYGMNCLGPVFPLHFVVLSNYLLKSFCQDKL